MSQQRISKSLKMEVWTTYVGKHIGCVLCPICKSNEIRMDAFEAGHVIPVCKNGEMTVRNLRPICNVCNKSVGGNYMDPTNFKYISSIENNQTNTHQITHELEKMKKRLEDNTRKLEQDRQIREQLEFERLERERLEQELLNIERLELEQKLLEYELREREKQEQAKERRDLEQEREKLDLEKKIIRTRDFTKGKI